MFQDPRYLSMIGLEARNVKGLTKGIHLRWQFGKDVESTISLDGFDLERRLHIKLSEKHWTAIPVNPVQLLADLATHNVSVSEFCTVSTNVDITYDSTHFGVSGYVGIADDTNEHGKITIDYNFPVRGFRMKELHKDGTVTVKAYANSVEEYYLVGQAKSAGSWEHKIEADLITRIEISFDGKICITNAQQAANLDEHYDDWDYLGHFNFPANWEEASSRIPKVLADKLETGFPQLSEIISKVSGNYSDDPTLGLPGFPEYLDETGQQNLDPTFTLYPLNLLLLMSMNSAIARVLGLYFIDENAEAGKHYDYKITGSWSKDSGITKETHKWICYDLTLLNPDPLKIPDGLVVSAKKLNTRTHANTQTGISLRWSIPDYSEMPVAAGTPVMYHIYRKQGTKLKKLTKNKPVIVGHNDVNRPFYIDGPLDDGSYSYQISCIDLFGRESELSDEVTIELVDIVPPPPPIKVSAKLDNRTMSASVSWVWDESRKAIAPDAKSFRIYYQTQNLISPESFISKVTSSSGVTLVETELDTAFDYTPFTNGFVLQNGRKFRITSIAEIGGKITISVNNVTVTTTSREGNRLVNSQTELKPIAYDSSLSSIRTYLRYTDKAFKSPGRFLLQLDWSNKSNWIDSGKTVNVADRKTDYQTEILTLPIVISKSIPVAYAMIGVSTVDESGNEGAISVPANVAAYWATKPDAPELPSAVEFATRADYYGKSYYTLKLSSFDPDYYYEIMRTTDAAIAFIRNGTSRNSDEINDSELLVFAALSDYEKAFVCVGRAEGTISEFTDSFPGKVRNRYLYRTIAVDKAGNRSELSDGVVLVKLHDVTPPRAPVITKILGGDRQITIHWAKNREKDLAGYRIYRAETEEAAEDIRLMTLVSELLKDEASYTDSVEGLKDYWYRETAFDQGGSESNSTLCKAMAYNHETPEEPSLIRAEWVKIDSNGNEFDYTSLDTELKSAIVIEFSVSQYGVQACIQEKESDYWKIVSLWQSDDGTRHFTFYLTNADPSNEYIFRAKLINVSGIILEASEEQMVKAVTEA